VCFAQHTLGKCNLGWLGLKPRTDPLFFFVFRLGLAQPVWAGLNPVSPPWSLAQASDSAGQQARMNQLMRALHSAKVINYLCTVL